MTSTESTPTPTRDDYVRWGTAPEDRQCRYTFASGYHCLRWSVRGHEYCQEHGRWMECRVDGPIEVPLMEDPQAVQLVATQTVRAMGWGQIPPANGRAILHGCRVVQTGFAQDLALAKFLLKCHQLGVDPNNFLPPRPSASGAGAPLKPVVGLSGIEEEARVPHVSPSLRDTGEPGVPLKPGVGLSGIEEETRVPHVSPVLGDIGQRDSAPSEVRQTVILSEARSAQSKDLRLTPPSGLSASADKNHDALKGHGFSRAVESQTNGASAPDESLSNPIDTSHNLSAATAEPTPYPLPPIPCFHPLDDIPPAPRPKSVCEPCVAALVQGADESLLDCEHCPAYRAGNLRAPQLPDPRNPPEPAYDPQATPSPRGPAFPHLKTKWDNALHGFSRQCAGNRYPKRYPLQTDKEYADERAAIRARPFDDYLRAPRTSPPPPVPTSDPSRS